MKILHISSFSTTTPPVQYGGTERLVHYLANELSLLGVESHLVRRSGSRGGQYTSTNVAPKMLVAKVKMLIAKMKPDIIHLHSKNQELIDFLSTQKIPVVITLYNNIRSTSSWTDLLKNPPSNFTFTAISKNLKARASQYAGKQKERQVKVVHIPPCYDLEAYRVAARKNSIHSAARTYFVYLGTIARYKSVADIAKSFVGLKENLVIVGPCNNPAEQAYFDEVISYTKHKNITYLGEPKNDKEKIAILQRAKGLIIATGLDKKEQDCHEAFGLVMLEANAAGTPVIGYKKGNIPDYICKNKNGIVFSDVAQLKSAIRDIQKKDWSRECIRYAENFDSKVIAKQYANLYRKIISDTRS